MSAKLNYLHQFSHQDLSDNRKGELSERQIHTLQDRIDDAFNTVVLTSLFTIIGAVISMALLYVGNLPDTLQVVIGGGMFILLTLPIIAFLLYRRTVHLIDSGEVAALHNVRKADFMPFENDDGELCYRYAAVEATIVFDTHTMSEIDPNTAYNIYYWTVMAGDDSEGNNILSIEPVVSP